MVNLLAALVAFSVAEASTAQTAPRPVQVGGDADLDACGSVGQVVRLNPKGDNFLSVRAAPNEKAMQVAKLGPKATVTLCDQTPGGAWYAIVFPRSGQASVDCKVSSPIAKRQVYRGPCASGWVSAKFIEIIAG